MGWSITAINNPYKLSVIENALLHEYSKMLASVFPICVFLNTSTCLKMATIPAQTHTRFQITWDIIEEVEIGLYHLINKQFTQSRNVMPEWRTNYTSSTFR
jgi:hypothetical protein